MEKELKSKIDFLCNKKYKSLDHCLEWINRKFKGYVCTIGYIDDFFAKNKVLVKIEKTKVRIYFTFHKNENDLKFVALLNLPWLINNEKE